MTRLMFSLAAIAVLTGCSTYSPERYVASTSNAAHLRAMRVNDVAVGDFISIVKVDARCRESGPITPPDKMTFETYIQKAFTEELRLAGVLATSKPKTTLKGVVTRLNFSSSKGLVNGEWNIAVTVKSSNGRQLAVSETYGFDSGLISTTACKQTAEAFLTATQNVIQKIIFDPTFKTLLH